MYRLSPVCRKLLWQDQAEADLIGAGQGKTILMCAIKGKMEAMCHKLIELGADINAKDEYVPPLSGIWHSSGMLRSSRCCVDVLYVCRDGLS